MDARKIKLHVLLISFLLISGAPSILGLSMSTRGTTRSKPEEIHGGIFPAMKSRKLMVMTNLEVGYSGDYYDARSSPLPPVPDYDDIYRRQGDVPSPGIGH
ncbi:Precursor of CEP15 [Cardamine amara subsp. amara]|uniref:Precursor of CEP15 n=1 Tax=Cardamine amara subsp. amara TaxID=228776 RepID=A0ABD1BQI5_CARAN